MRFIISFCLTLIFGFGMAISAFAADESDAGNLPPGVENALSALLTATAPGQVGPGQDTVTAVLEFITRGDFSASKIRPARRPQGQGVFVREHLNIPLQKIISYTLNPAIPGEVIYPAVVRRNSWMPGSDILNKGAELAGLELPPTKMMIIRGSEFEETTPDVSSGCYYSYHLDRLFVLVPYNNRTALFSISRMPKASDVGKKGAIIGRDADWTHVYSGVTGTNIPMLGWAETHLYSSDGVSVFLDQGDGTDLYMFKWAKAGWAGSNVVRPKHIIAGLQRFVATMRQVLENPHTPSPAAIATTFSSLRQRSDAELRVLLSGYAHYLAKQPDDILQEKPFATVLAEGGYATTLSRDKLIAELMKLYLRRQLGTLPAEAAATLD